MSFEPLSAAPPESWRTTLRRTPGPRPAPLPRFRERRRDRPPAVSGFSSPELMLLFSARPLRHRPLLNVDSPHARADAAQNIVGDCSGQPGDLLRILFRFALLPQDCNLVTGFQGL